MFSVGVKRGPVTGGGSLVSVRANITQPNHGEVTVACVTSWTAYCCGLNSLQNLEVGYLHYLGDNWGTLLLDWLSLGEIGARYPGSFYPQKDFIFACGDHQMDKYSSLLKDPRVSEIARFPSRSEPGHDICLYLIKL